MSEMPILSVIVPCFNEEECIQSTTKRLLEVLNELVAESVISDDSFIFYVDDGSNDKTWELIEKVSGENSGKVKGVKFSRNFGNQKAILAGLTESRKYNPDCFITIDADLQQDETKIKEFVRKYKNGAQIVCGIRTDRNTGDTFAYDTVANKSKKQREDDAAKRLFAILPDDQAEYIKSLWIEFDRGVTNEAKYANCMDKLQPFFHNIMTEGHTWQNADIPVSKKQVENRMACVKEFMPQLYIWVEKSISAAAERQWLSI